MSGLEGTRAVVTGATSGIGEALAERLVKSGVCVLGVGRDAGKLERVRSRLGAAFEPVLCDLADAGARAGVAERLKNKPIDILVNNAAEVLYAAPTELDLDTWRRAFEVNLFAGIELVRAIAPEMKPRAQIVNLSSVTARSLPQPKFAPYALTKIALEGFTDALRQELAPRGVKVLLVAPGLVDTPIYDKVDGFERMKTRLREQVPTWLSSDDVAEAIVWALARPAHVVVSELVLLPQGQSR